VPGTGGVQPAFSEGTGIDAERKRLKPVAFE